MSDPMPTEGGAVTAPKHEPLLCEFCESKLTRRGQVIDLSDKARALRKLQDTIDTLRGKNEEQAGEIARLNTELAEARAAVEPAKKGGGWFDMSDDE